eukprot:13935027-Alexandrium_andersonii.AAC.1
MVHSGQGRGLAASRTEGRGLLRQPVLDGGHLRQGQGGTEREGKGRQAGNMVVQCMWVATVEPEPELPLQVWGAEAQGRGRHR